jgi:hypothetical protein
MAEAFHKFRHTPHLLWLGTGSPREDKVLKAADVEDFLAGELIVEEKVDGANMGLSPGPSRIIGGVVKPRRLQVFHRP